MKAWSTVAWVAGLALVSSEIALAGVSGKTVLMCVPEAFHAPSRGLKGITVKITDVCEGAGLVARLREVTFRRFGSKKKELAVLPCKDVSGSVANPDEQGVALECENPNIVDAGYRVRITQPGFTGLRSAVVSKKSMLGEVDLAELVCKAVGR